MGAPGGLLGRAPRCHWQRLDETRHLGFAQCLVAVEGPGLAIHEEEAEARANSAGPSSGSRDKRKRHDDNLAFSSWLSDKFGDDDGDEGDDSGTCVRLTILYALLPRGIFGAGHTPVALVPLCRSRGRLAAAHRQERKAHDQRRGGQSVA